MQQDARPGTTVGAGTAAYQGRERRAVRSEDQLARDFDALVDNAPDAIARVGRDGRLLYVNRVLASLLKREASDLIGSRIAALALPVDVVVAFRKGVRRTVRTSKETAFDFSVDVGDGMRFFAVRIVPERDAAGRVESALTVAYDVTQRTEAERQRDLLFEREQAARAKAEASARARDQFLAIVSHELRSPLNGIQSWSHVLENQFTGPERANPVAMRALEGIRAGIDQQVHLIEHLLDATVAMTGELRLMRQSILLREALEAAIAEVRSGTVQKDIALHVELRIVDDRLDGDAHRIRQIFGHLLSNALKFTPNGGSIWLSAHRESERAVIAVRDSGRGLAAGFETWLFEPFGQADRSNTRRAGGIGLGVALARRLAELHGGQVTAESAGPHLGSTFTVTLPLERKAPAVRAAPASGGPISRALAGVVALVIDDQLEAREALRALLSQFGADVAVAPSSQAGIDLIVRDDLEPNIVICDIAMPEEDGYAFVRRLRAHEAGLAGDRIPVIALSAFAEPDRPAPPDSAFDFYLAKPASPQQLLAALSRFATGSDGQRRDRRR